MGVETATTIGQLNQNWPLGTDPRSQGDDHLRLIKAVMKNDAVSKAATVPQALAGPLDTAQLTGGSQDFTGNVDVAGYMLNTGRLAMKVRSSLAPSGDAWSLYRNGALVFNVTRAGATSNVTGTISVISDPAEKHAIADATPKLEDLMRLRVINYVLNAMPEAGKLLGFDADNMAEVFPALVTQRTDHAGSPIGPREVTWSVLVPILVKALQELTARVEALEA